jgi:hypothetical protein
MYNLLNGFDLQRDAVGRKPRRKVWAEEGLIQFDRNEEESGAPSLSCKCYKRDAYTETTLSCA